MSADEALYRVRVADLGATTVAGNVAATLTQADDLVEPPILQGPTVDVLKGSVTSHPTTIRCKSDGALFASSGRLQILSRLIEIQRSLDAGGSYSTLGTGRISRATEPERGLVDITVSDERWIERNTEVFKTTDSVQLWPPGLVNGWMAEPAAGYGTLEVKEVSGSYLHVGLGDDDAGIVDILQVPKPLLEALADDVVPPEDIDVSTSNQVGNFQELRFDDGVSANWRVVSFTSTLNSTRFRSRTGLLGNMSPESIGTLFDAWIYHPAAQQYQVGDSIQCRFHWPGGIPVRPGVPLHIGGTAGIHPMTLARDVLDGDYGGGAMLYDSDTLDDLEALGLRRVWARIKAPGKRSDWLFANCYSVYFVLPLIATDLTLRPTVMRQPQDVDPDSLPTLDASNAKLPTWDHVSRDLVTVLRMTSRGVRKLDDASERDSDWPADGLEDFELELPELTHDTVTVFGRHVREVKTELILGSTYQVHRGQELALRVATELAVELFNVLGDGPQRGEIMVADDEDVDVGDLVVLDHDQLQGFNPQTGDRSGSRVVRLISFRSLTPGSKLMEYLDLGPKLGVLSAPTVSIVQPAGNPDVVDVTVSNLPTGSTAIVEVANPLPEEGDEF